MKMPQLQIHKMNLANPERAAESPTLRTLLGSGWTVIATVAAADGDAPVIVMVLQEPPPASAPEPPPASSLSVEDVLRVVREEMKPPPGLSPEELLQTLRREVDAILLRPRPPSLSDSERRARDFLFSILGAVFFAVISYFLHSYGVIR